MLTPESGTVIGEKYRILRPLGEGGMGTVYEVENLLTLKRAAIKILHPRLMGVEDAGKRLLYEARATSRIRHHNVVDIYDVLLHQSSVFLVMELLLGESLAEHLKRNTLPLHGLIRLLLPAMRGVEAAHAVGVVHRDIKPDNIFLAQEAGHPEPVPKVIDFGISRVFSASDEGRLTRSGMTMGTPRYVSYEQLRGARDVDVRADVYAFGVILYEALTGRSPYAGTTLSEQAIEFATTVPAAAHELRADVPLELSQLVRTAIEKDRDQRIPSMRDLIAQLLPFADAAAYAAPLLALGPIPEPVYPTLDGPHLSTASTEGLTPVDLQLAHLSASLPSPRHGRYPARWLAATLAGVVCVAVGWLTLRPTEQLAAKAALARGPVPSAPLAGALTGPAPRVNDSKAQAAQLPTGPSLVAEPIDLADASRESGLIVDAAVQAGRVRASRVRREISSPPATPATPAAVEVAPKQERPTASGSELRAGGMTKDQF